jgi:hypothetical protein
VEVVITEWALDSYLDLKHQGAFSLEQFNAVIRPDVELLKEGLPLRHPKFRNSHFWGPAQDINGLEIPCGFKMKWHNLGNGRNQIRLTVCIIEEKAYLCHAYIKTSDSQDKRYSARLKNRIADIRHRHFVLRGYL